MSKTFQETGYFSLMTQSLFSEFIFLFCLAILVLATLSYSPFLDPLARYLQFARTFRYVLQRDPHAPTSDRLNFRLQEQLRSIFAS